MATTHEMIAALHRRYPQNKGKWANVVEFESIDFLSVACWPSLKYVVHGHEVKVSRSDWLRELKNPAKSLRNMPMCDMWWLVAPKGVAKEEELPPRWGFLEHNGYSFWCVRQAELLRPPLTRRSAAGTVAASDYVNRESFAKLARRYAYAQADRDHLLVACTDPRPHLESAAAATGRFTLTQREEQAEWRKRQREMARKGWR